MKKKTFKRYDEALQYVTDKDMVLHNFYEQSLDKLQSMFVYEGLPETIPASDLEYILMTEGKAFITEESENLWAFRCSPGGELDVYYHPKTVIVTNEALQLSKEYTVDEDGVLMLNDYNRVGLIPLMSKYGVLICDAHISMRLIGILARITMMVSAGDDKTKASADIFIKKIMDGDYGVIAESQFLEGVKMQAPNTNSATRLTDFIELMQYYVATYHNELGLQQNYNMKRERLNTKEIAANTDVILPLADNMLRERKLAIAKINDMYGTDITVDFGSSWKREHETLEQEIDIADTEILETPLYADTSVADEDIPSDNEETIKTVTDEEIEPDTISEESVEIETAVGDSVEPAITNEDIAVDDESEVDDERKND